MNTLSNSSKLQVSFGTHSHENLTVELLFHGNFNVLLNFTSACCVIFIISGIPGNLISFIALARCKKIRNATAIFIINLNIGDFLYCVLVLPLTAMTFAKKYWGYGYVMCDVHTLLHYALRTSSIITILAITINRYILVCHPLIYPRLYTKRNTSIMLMAIWISSFALFLPSIFEWGKFDLDDDRICKLLNTKNTKLPTKLYLYVTFFGPCLVIVLCYARIWWVVRKTAAKCQGQSKSPVNLPISYTQSNTSTNGQSLSLETIGDNNPSTPNEHKTFKKYFKSPFGLTRKVERSKTPTRRDNKLFPMITAIMLSFCSTYLPILLIKTFYEDYKSVPEVYVFANLFEYLGNCMNPIIYVLMSNEYREAYKTLYNSIMKKNAG